MTHEECLAYMQLPGVMEFEPGSHYGKLQLSINGDEYCWAVENYDGCVWSPIPDYLGDALVNYYCEKSKY